MVLALCRPHIPEQASSASTGLEQALLAVLETRARAAEQGVSVDSALRRRSQLVCDQMLNEMFSPSSAGSHGPEQASSSSNGAALNGPVQALAASNGPEQARAASNGPAQALAASNGPEQALASSCTTAASSSAAAVALSVAAVAASASDQQNPVQHAADVRDGRIFGGLHNPWNLFQHEHRGKGWSPAKMSSMYQKWRGNPKDKMP